MHNQEIANEDIIIYEHQGRMVWRTNGEQGFNLNWKFIFTTWLIAEVAVLVFVGIVALLLNNIIDNNSTDASMMTILSGLSTFAIFFAVLAMRLPKLELSRFFNSVSVSLMHVLFGLLFLAVNFGLEMMTGTSLADLLPSSAYNEGGLGFYVLERSAAAAIPAGLLAAAIMPRRGPIPKETQVGDIPEKRQL